MEKLQKLLEDWRNAGKTVSSFYEHPIMSNIRMVEDIAKDAFKVARRDGISKAVNYLTSVYEILIYS